MSALPARGRRCALRAYEPEEPERLRTFSMWSSLDKTSEKRPCKPLEPLPNQAGALLIDCAMELDSKQKISAGSGPWAAKTKQNSVSLENHGSRGPAQPCPRCIAGESGHFNHILGF